VVGLLIPGGTRADLPPPPPGSPKSPQGRAPSSVISGRSQPRAGCDIYFPPYALLAVSFCSPPSPFGRVHLPRRVRRVIGWVFRSDTLPRVLFLPPPLKPPWMPPGGMAWSPVLLCVSVGSRVTGAPSSRDTWFLFFSWFFFATPAHACPP